jgi:hypothetical protein
MLRISVRQEADAWTLQLEGKLIGPWVHEARTCWEQVRSSQRRSTFKLDLAGVTMIDNAGRSFLSLAHAHGAELVASGCLMRAIVAQVIGSCLPGGAS